MSKRLAEAPNVHNESEESFNTFQGLFDLNVGVALSPLASDTPVEELGEEVIRGISSLPKTTIREIVRDYADEDNPDEAKNMITRYKLIRAVSRSACEGAVVKPTSKVETPRVRRTRKEILSPRSLKDTIDEIIFGDPAIPAISRVPEVIKKRPVDPTVPDLLCGAFENHGFALSQNAKEESVMTDLGKEILDTSMSAYNKYLLGEDKNLQFDTLTRLLKNWLPELTVSECPVSLGMRAAVVGSTILKLGPTIKSPSAITKTLSTLEEGLTNLSERHNSPALFLHSVSVLINTTTNTMLAKLPSSLINRYGQAVDPDKSRSRGIHIASELPNNDGNYSLRCNFAFRGY